MISPEEYLQSKGSSDIPSPEAYAREKSATGLVSPEEYIKNKSSAKPEMEKKPFIARHPNLYGVYGATKAIAEAVGKVGHFKYADPYEFKRLMKLPPKEMKRQLMMDTLEDVSMLAFGAKPKSPIKSIPAKVSASTKKVAQDVVEEVTAPPVVKRVTESLKSAKPIRKEQEKLYTLERGQKVKKAQEAGEGLQGEARARAETQALSGEMGKVQFEPFKIDQTDADELFNIIKEKIPYFWDGETAKRGLRKMFQGSVPQNSEIIAMRKAFPEEFVNTLKDKRPMMAQMTELGYEAINVPRALMSSYDLSAPLRQGIFLSARHPVRASQSFLQMFKQFGSEKAYQAAQAAMRNNKMYAKAKDSGLSLTDLGESLTTREESFMGGQLAEKIPLIGRGVRASGRAYTGFLNKLRFDVYGDMAKYSEKLGRSFDDDPVLAKEFAKFINAATGRGSLGQLESSAKILNSFFFSPRLMSSRLTLLNPAYYIKADPLVRKEALKSLFAFSGLISTTLGLAKAGGAKVGTDIRSANFGKIQIGNTRLDIMGGFQPYLRSAGQLASGKYISSTTGEEYTLGEGYKPLTRLGIIGRQFESKLAPPASFVKDLLRGNDIEGKPISVPKEVGKRFTPMIIQDIYELAEDDPDLLPLAMLGAFGVGVQTYGPRQRASGGIGGIQSLGGLEGL